MKTTTQLFMMALVTIGFMTTAAAQTAPAKQVLIGISDAYVPSGFDSNSDAYVVASGVYPNGCYRWDKADVQHVSATVHEVRSFASVQQGMCLMVLVPFTKDIQLGKLEAGKHQIRFIGGDGTYLEKNMTIE